MNKNVIVTIALVLVIIAAAVFIARQVMNHDVKIPDAVKTVPEERIDQETGQLMTKTVGEWEKLGETNGKYKNPDTGTYTMVVPFVCTVCGATIPPVDLPEEYTRQLPDEESRTRVASEVLKLKAAVICPKCGKQAYANEGMPRLE